MASTEQRQTLNGLGVAASLVCSLSSCAMAAAYAGGPDDITTPPLNIQQAFQTPSPWRIVVTAQSSDYDGTGPGEKPPSNAQVCFLRADAAERRCAYFRDLFHSTLTWQSSDDISIQVLTSGNIKGLVLHATGAYPTGDTHETAIWTYDRQRDAFDLAAALSAPEVRVFSRGPLEGYLATAQWQWASGETRFGDDHRRKISLYRYVDSNGVGSYQPVLEYVTDQKYDPENTDTLDSEIDTLQSKLRSGS